MVNVLFWFKFGFSLELTLVLLTLTLRLFTLWFRDITRESAFQGQHTTLVQRGLKWGLIWFLFREVWFFFRVFWRFFHMRVSPLTSRRWSWPFMGLEIIPPFQVPLLNTLILLMRGVTATLAHQELLRGQKTDWIIIRMILGLYFLSLQGVEYYAASFIISSGAFGRIFFFRNRIPRSSCLLGSYYVRSKGWPSYKKYCQGTTSFWSRI